MVFFMDYFFVAVSSREHLEICKKFAMAGFPNSTNGLWAFLDIDIGDYISFIYSARAINLYKVMDKVAIQNYENAPPWPPLKLGRKIYWFPFRLILKPIREFEESIVRKEFEYIAENLLLRGGYRKSHFQADSLTLHHASIMGTHAKDVSVKHKFKEKFETFEPVFNLRTNQNDWNSGIFKLSEKILQTLIRKKIKNRPEKFLSMIDVNENMNHIEVIGEKALPEGHVDIIIKERYPVESVKAILIEVKKGRANKDAVNQLLSYKKSVRYDVIRLVLIAKDFPKQLHSVKNIVFLKYEIKTEKETLTFSELLNALEIYPHTK